MAEISVPGYTSWNNYVSKLEGCDTTPRTSCGTFAPGKRVYFIIKSVCTWSGNTCTSITNYSLYSNDPYGLLSILTSSLNEFYSGTGRATVDNIPRGEDEYGLVYDVKINNPSGQVDGGYARIGFLNIPLCAGYVEGFGCPNDKNSEDPLDRTKIKNGPCTICSDEGNPVDVRNGAKKEFAKDLDFPLSVERIYYSKMKFPGMFGVNWRSNYDKKVLISKNSNNEISSLIFLTPDDQQIIFTKDSSGNLVQGYKDDSQYKLSFVGTLIKLVKPDSSVEYYDAQYGYITSENYKGKILNYTYQNGLLYKVTSGSGHYLQFYYSGYANVVEQITASNGDILQYSYSNGNISNVKFNDISQITYGYNGLLLTAKYNASNIQYASFIYDEKGRGIENKWITNDGHELKKHIFSYTDYNTIVTQGNGLTKTYSIDTFNYAKRINSVNWNGYTEQTSFDGNGNVTTKKDYNGVYEYYNYDDSGRIISYSKAGKQVILNWNNATNQLVSMTENSPNGNRTTSFEYDAIGNTITKTVTGNNGSLTWHYSWNQNGDITSETSPNGLVTTYTYFDVDGSPVSGLLKSVTTNGGKSLVVNSYDVRGNPTSVTVNGVTKTMTYDYKGRILSESTAGITNTYTYDLEGNMLTMQLASGYQLSMSYDSAGRLLSIADNMGGSSTFTNDDYTGEVLNTNILQNNNLVRARNNVLDALGRTVQTWNATNRTKKSINYYSYIDKPNSKSDANGNNSNYGWNEKGLIGSYSDAGTSSSNNYDVDGNLTSVVVNNQQTTYSYDDFGQLVQLSSPDSGNHTFTNDIQNRTVVHNDARGTSHTSVKDLNGNVTSVSHVNGGNSQTENYSYDNQGHLAQISDGSGTTTYSRNILGQVTSKTQNIGGKSFTVQYGYNGIGQKVSETYPSGLVISYSYNNGFLNSINVGGTSVVSNINYNSMLKEAISWNLGGSQVSVIKDADGLLTGFIDSGYLNQSITTDNEGHILSVADNVSNNNFNIQLTPDYKIQSGTINGKNLNYNYAYNHNLYIQNDGIANYNFSASFYNNKFANITDQNWNYYFYQYDAVGNTIVDNKGTYAYDLNNNMISSSRTYTVNGNQVTSTGTYVFNGLGHRVKKNVSGQIRYFVYNENNQLIGEYDCNGNVIAEYVYFGLRPVAVKNSSNINIVHTDYLTTPRIVTSGGSIVWQWRNDNPYGNNLAQGNIEFNLRFAGQYYDAESGFHYNIHRTYNPEIGRYMQSDPMGLSAGSNTYNYVGRNPFDAVDPLGLFWQYVIPTAAGGVVGGVIGGIINYDTKVGFWNGFKEGAFTGAITGLKAEVEKSIQTYSLSIDKEAKFK